jgi:hypothetical protein
MSPRWIRRIVIVMFLAGIAGMIVGSVADNNGMAITFGLLTATAAVGLILVSSVAPPEAFRKGGLAVVDARGFDEATAVDVEARIRILVEAGADEDSIRQLVQRAVQLGQNTEPAPRS